MLTLTHHSMKFHLVKQQSQKIFTHNKVCLVTNFFLPVTKVGIFVSFLGQTLLWVKKHVILVFVNEYFLITPVFLLHA